MTVAGWYPGFVVPEPDQSRGWPLEDPERTVSRENGRGRLAEVSPDIEDIPQGWSVGVARHPTDGELITEFTFDPTTGYQPQ